MKVVIVGYGWLGSQLALALQGQGHQVFVTKRSKPQLTALPAGIQGVPLELGYNLPPEPDVLAAMHDAMIVCAVPPGKSSTRGHYETALTELAAVTQLAGSRGVIHFSSSGIYEGLQDDVDESALLDLHSERVQRLLAGEKALQQIPCCITLRLAGLMGPGRHPGRFIAGKVVTESGAPVNMVHSTDIIAAVSLLLAQSALSSNTFNLNCPALISRCTFYTQAAQHINTDIIFSSEKTPGSNRRVNPDKFIRTFAFNYRFYSACDALTCCS